jgi:hypothetical protein
MHRFHHDHRLLLIIACFIQDHRLFHQGSCPSSSRARPRSVPEAELACPEHRGPGLPCAVRPSWLR